MVTNTDGAVYGKSDWVTVLEARGFYCDLTQFLYVSMKRVVVQDVTKTEVGILVRSGDHVGIIELCIIVAELYGPLVVVSCGVLTGVEYPRLEEICTTLFRGSG